MPGAQPDIGEIWRTLDEGTANLALIVGPNSNDLAANLAVNRGLDVGNAGLLLTKNEAWREPERSLRAYRVLTNLDVVFSREILISPMRLLTRLARRHSVVAVWPGEISDGVASYSEPGRRDHFESQVPDEALVVRTKTTTFPDQASFEVERIR
jgi:hypothetical protein